MAIILETGTGISDANSYVSLTIADTYYSARNNSTWSVLTDDQKTTAIIRATDYIDANYVFFSVPLTSTQALENPRLSETALAKQLVKATCELALIASANDIFSVDNDSNISSETKSGDGIGSISISYKNSKADKFEIITNILKPIAKSRTSSVIMGRLIK